ncbi:MAG: TraI/MobA(P) family conjugative relaxase [Bacteroidota bacterium]
MIAKIVPARTEGDFVRLGRYITESKADEHISAAERLGHYVLDSRHAGEKVAWSRVSNCATDDPRMAMLEIRNTQARNTRATHKTVHLVVSFPAGERPRDLQLRQIEQALCESLGMAKHQRLSALHVNTRHAHLHVAINRVHPHTHTCADSAFNYRRLARACHELEREFGLTRTNHGLTRDEVSRAPVKGRAADMEAHSGQHSFTRWVRENVRDELMAAKAEGWQALHAAAARNGLRLRPRGAGLVFTDTAKPDRAVKASTVDRGLSMGALVKACGAYQPAPEHALPAHQRYQAQPLQRHPAARPLHEKYLAERTAALEARARQIAAWREEQRAYRKQLTAWYREEKHKLAHDWLASLAPDKAQRRRELSQQRAKLWERSCKAEQDGIAKIRHQYLLPTWKGWLLREAGRDTRPPPPIPHRQEAPQPGLPPTQGAQEYLPLQGNRQGEYLYLGVQEHAGTPCLIWQQGTKLYTQPATRNAMMLAQDVEKGDTVVFYQGRPIITRGNERDLGLGR